MSRHLDIGIASYGSSEKLLRTVRSIQQFSHTDYRLFIIDNPGIDPRTRPMIEDLAKAHKQIVPVYMDSNEGYAGAVNRLLDMSETEYILYCDNDVLIHTDGWDEKLCKCLDMAHEIGIVFPNVGVAPIPRASYSEVLWCPGYTWCLNRLCFSEVGHFDQTLGHQEEADYALRVRMAGWKCASLASVRVGHDAVASTDPANILRINRGIVNWVNKWCLYFYGKNMNYHSPNVVRWDEWPPNQWYMEEYWLKRFPDLNKTPETVTDGATTYDLMRLPRLQNYYRGRII
jgi:GT2 family glycosyltransferase